MSGTAHAVAKQLIDEAKESTEALFNPPRWTKNTTIEEVDEAYRTIHNIYNINVPNIFATNPRELNKLIIAAYNSHDELSMASFVARRLKWWLKVEDSADLDNDGLAQVVIDSCRQCCKALPHHVVCSCFKVPCECMGDFV